MRASTIVLALLLLGGTGTALSNNEIRSQISPVLQLFTDYFDKRPVKHVLLIGNSRTYYHHMPALARAIADSAKAPIRYDFTMRAWGGATFEDNFNNEDVRRILTRRWDYVILQGESRAQSSPEGRRSFLIYGEKLILAAKAGGSPVALLVNWAYSNELWAPVGPSARAEQIRAIKSDNQSLAAREGVRLIDVASVWETALARDNRLKLYEDGNHPTLAGSYLSALTIYKFLSGGQANAVRYAPSGLSPMTAELIKSATDQPVWRF